VIGATTLVLIGELLQKTPYLQPILYSCILILVIYLMPKGLIDFPRVVWGNAVKPLYTRVLGG
jgi:ABC-type branched-subunit amino acid transport system permease subunit